MTLRPDLELVAGLIPSGSRVLDVGCAGGTLLRHLIDHQACTGTGVEIDPDAVLAAIRIGVPVIELDVDEDLGQFEDDSYDVVVLSRTLQAMRNLDHVLEHIARIGSRMIISVPNFGWWRHRLRLLGGRMPMSKELPYAWYNSPNIRFTTLVDLEDLFARLGLVIERRIALNLRGEPLRGADRAANLLAGAAVYVLRR